MSRSKSTSPRHTSGGAKPAAKAAAHGRAPGLTRHLPWLLAILAITFIVYIPSLDNELTNWDDTQYVTDNLLLIHPNLAQILVTPVGGNLHPLTILSLAINYKMGGVAPAPYHWTNLLLHLANTALVFLFVWMLSRGRKWTTILTSLLFGIHPMHVESVAWVAERKDVLYTLFYLAGLIAYLRYIDPKQSRRGLWYAATAVAFVLSLASKPAAVVFPVTLLAIDWFRGRAWSRRVFLEKLPLFAASIATGLLTLRVQVESGALEKQFPVVIKVLSVTYGLVMYIVKLVAPIHLAAIHPFPNVEGHGPSLGFYAAFVVAVVGIPIALYLLRRHKPTLFGFAFYVINVALVLQVVAVGKAVMAERYTYVPYIGLLFALAWPLDDRSGAPGAQRPLRQALAAGFAILVAFSLVQTYRRTEVWRNSEVLWNDTIEKYPHRVVDAYVNRGYYYHMVTKRYDAALADYDEALRLNPRVPNAWNDRGMLLSAMGRQDSAIVCFDRAIAYRPNFESAWGNRGGVKIGIGKTEEGIADITHAIELNPAYRDAFANRAVGYSMQGNHEGVVRDCRRVVELMPDHPGNYLYYGLMGGSLEALGRYSEAVSALDEAIRRAPPGETRRAAYERQRVECLAKLKP